MAPRSTKMGAASRVASESVAPGSHSVNSLSETTLKGATMPEPTYCQYLGSIVTKLDRVARIPKLIVESAANCVLSSSTSERTAHLKSISIRSIKAILVLIGLFAFSVYVLPPHRSPLVIIYSFCPGMTSQLRQLLLNSAPRYFLAHAPADILLPHLNAAPSISTKDFDMDEPVEISSNAVARYKIIPATEHLQSLRNALDSYTAGKPAHMHEALDSLISDVIPHVHRSHALISLDQIVYFGLVKERGAYFPGIHWDTDWLQFPGVDGFQIWYLLEENDETGGNMFMANTNDLSEDDPPVTYVPTENDRVRKSIAGPDIPVKFFSNLTESGLEFQYLDMHAGDCLIFSKRTLHMSDPRPLLAGKATNRLALNVRLIVREKDEDTIPFWPDHIYQKMFPMYSGLKSWALKQVERADKSMRIVIRVPVSRFDMLDFLKSPW